MIDFPRLERTMVGSTMYDEDSSVELLWFEQFNTNFKYIVIWSHQAQGFHHQIFKSNNFYECSELVVKICQQFKIGYIVHQSDKVPEEHRYFDYLEQIL